MKRYEKIVDELHDIILRLDDLKLIVERTADEDSPDRTSAIKALFMANHGVVRARGLLMNRDGDRLEYDRSFDGEPTNRGDRS